MESNKITIPIRFIETQKEKELKAVSFSIPGEPMGKARPRVTVRGGFGRAYTPKNTIDYENKVKDCYNKSNKNIMLQAPIAAEFIFYYPIPKSISKKKAEQLKESNKVFHVKKKDIDNTCKICMDALNGLAYQDDAGISVLNAKKFYSENPRVDVILKELEHSES